MNPDALNTLILEMIPQAFLLTPNIPEAETITGKTLKTTSDIKEAAKIIHDMGAQSVLIKGGHRDGDAEDILFDGQQFYHYSSQRIPTRNTHGTGCTYSSAISANLAGGMPVRDAVAAAKDYITQAIRYALPIGEGYGPVNHFYSSNAEKA